MAIKLQTPIKRQKLTPKKKILTKGVFTDRDGKIIHYEYDKLKNQTIFNET